MQNQRMQELTEEQIIEVTRNEKPNDNPDGEKQHVWVKRIIEKGKEIGGNPVSGAQISDIQIRKDRNKEEPRIIAKVIQDRIKNKELKEMGGIQKYMDRKKGEMSKLMFDQKYSPQHELRPLNETKINSKSQLNNSMRGSLDKIKPNDKSSTELVEIEKKIWDGPTKETIMMNAGDDKIDQLSTDYFIHESKLYRVNKEITKDDSNHFVLRISVFKLSQEQFQKDLKGDEVLNETLISYGDEKPDLKIDVGSKLYLQAGALVYFYQQNSEDEVSLMKVDITLEEGSSLVDKKQKIRSIKIDDKKKFLGGIFGDENVMNQQVACFDPECQPKIETIDENKIYSMLAIYEDQQDKNFEFKLFKGDLEFNPEMKFFNQNVQINQKLGQRLVLAVVEDPSHVLVIKSNENSVQLVIDNDNQMKALNRQAQNTAIKEQVDKFFNMLMHQIYYIQEYKYTFKIEKKSVKLGDLFKRFAILVLKLPQSLKVEQTRVNIIIPLLQKVMIIQTLYLDPGDKATNPNHFEKTFKTLEQKSTGWRTVSKWDPESKDVNLMAKSLYNYPYGILQIAPEISNAYLTIDDKVQVSETLNEAEKIDYSKVGDEFKFSHENQAVSAYFDQAVPKNQKHEFRPTQQRKIGSRRVTFKNDNRTVIPILQFDQHCNVKDDVKEQIYIEVIQKIPGGNIRRHKEIIQHSGEIKDAEKRMKLCQSSPIQYLNDNDRDEYRQNYQLCKQIKEEDAFLCYEIKEFQLTWNEKEDPKDLSNVTFKYIGMKILIQREKVDPMLDYQFNFMPLFKDNNSQLIGGTQLMPLKENLEMQDKEQVQYHVILENFDFQDYQFKGEILNSGFKIYRSQENLMDKNFLLIECEISQHYHDKVKWLKEKEKYDQDDELINLSSQEMNQLFYEQITVIMNIIPVQRFSDQPSKVFQREHFDIFTPLEYLDGNSLCDYMLQDSNQIKERLEEEQSQNPDNENLSIQEQIKQGFKKTFSQANKNKFMRKSLINDFVSEKNCKCKRKGVPDNWDKFPNNIQVQIKSQILTDLTFNNPLKRCLQEENDGQPKKRCFSIESARLLVNHIFYEEQRPKTVLEQRILMQSVPLVLEAYKNENSIKEFEKFFRNTDTKYSFFQERKYKGLPASISEPPKVSILKKESCGEQSFEGDMERQIVNEFKFHPRNDSKQGQRESIQVETYIIDFEPMITDTQVQILQGLVEDTQDVLSYYDEHDLAKILAQINEIYGDDIQRQQSIKALITYYFENRSKDYFQTQFIIYLVQCGLYVCSCTYFQFNEVYLNYMSPDDLKVLDDNSFAIRCLNVTLLISTFYFILIELAQFQESRKTEKTIWAYFDFMNTRDVIMDLLQIGLFSFRVYHPINGYSADLNILEVIILTLMLTKILFFLKIYSNYGMIVNLMSTIFYEISSFMLIFVMFIASFALQYYVMGAEFHDIKDDQIYYSIACFFNSYELSTGEEHNLSLKNPIHFQTAVVWIIWLSQQILMTIILLNFLIALITQQFEEAIFKLEVTQTKHKAELNKEYFIDQESPQRKFFTKKQTNRGKIYVLQMSTKVDQKDEEWNGISKQVERHISVKQDSLESKFKNNSNIISQIKLNQNNLKSQMDALKISIEDKLKM